LKENIKFSILVRDFAFPFASDELISCLDTVKEASARLAEGNQSQSDYEKLKQDVDVATLQLMSLKEALASGCMVTIKDANGGVVATGRNVPMSPLLEHSEFAAKIKKKTFEESEYKKVHGRIELPPSMLNEIWFGTQLHSMITKYVEMSCGTPITRRNQNCIDGYISQSASPARPYFCNSKELLCFADHVICVAVSSWLRERAQEDFARELQRQQHQRPSIASVGQVPLSTDYDQDKAAKVMAMRVCDDFLLCVCRLTNV